MKTFISLKELILISQINQRSVRSIIIYINDIVDEHKNTYHRSIKIKPIDVKSDSFAEDNEESNEKDLKFKVNNHVRISKYKNIFSKGYAPTCSEEIFVIKKIKKTVSRTYGIRDLNGKEIVGSFNEKEL